MPLCFALGVLLDLIVAAPQWGDVARGGLLNPDSYMRLVRLRAILEAGVPLHAVARDGSGAGTVLAWSHLLDSLLLLLAWPLRIALDQEAALHWASVAVGPLGMGGLCAALAWAFAPLTPREWRWAVVLPTCLSLPIAAYGLPGVLHHHVLIAVCAVMVGGWAARGPSRGAVAGVRAAAWGAFGLWLSPEVMPFILIAVGGLVLAWTKPGIQPGTAPAGAARATCALGATLLLLCGAIVAVDPPAAGVWASEIDRVSVCYVAMAAALLAAGLALCAVDRLRLPPLQRTLHGLAGAALPLLAWLVTDPRIVRGPEGLLTAEQTRAMFGVISEMQPVTTAYAGSLISVPGLLGAAAVIGCACRFRTRLWSYAAMCGLALVALGLAHERFATYGAALGAGMLPVLIGQLRPVMANVRLVEGLAAATVFVVLPPALHLAAAAAPGEGRSCSVAAAIPLLATFADAVVLADPGDTPELLYRTGVRTVGSLYHRNPGAYMRLRAAWRAAPSDTAPEAVRQTGAAAILACPGRERSRLMEDAPGRTLFDQLNEGDVPPWLQAAGEATDGAILYRVRPAGDAAP